MFAAFFERRLDLARRARCVAGGSTGGSEWQEECLFACAYVDSGATPALREISNRRPPGRNAHGERRFFVGRTHGWQPRPSNSGQRRNARDRDHGQLELARRLLGWSSIPRERERAPACAARAAPRRPRETAPPMRHERQRSRSKTRAPRPSPRASRRARAPIASSRRATSRGGRSAAMALPRIAR